MWLKSLYLRNWRSYSELAVEFGSGVNLIVGRNGLGKTNLLEAIYLISTGRSFRTKKLAEAIAQGESFFFIEAVVERDGIDETLSVSFDGKEKQVVCNGAKSKNLSSLLGVLPGTLYAPSDISLIDGAPAERRRFLDIHIAQSNPLYVYHLARYTKALRQRNTLLKQEEVDTLDVWENELAKSGTAVIEQREQMIFELSTMASAKLKELGLVEPLELAYRPSILEKNPELYVQHLKESREKELILGITQHGPHRDDFSILLDNKSAKSFASEGQKRSVLNALKLSEYERLCQQAGSLAIFAIDDFGMHLDPTRIEHVKEHLPSLGQSFLTSPVPCSIQGARTLAVDVGVVELV